MWKLSKGLPTVITKSTNNKTADKDDDELIEFTKLITVNMEDNVQADDSQIMDVNLTNSRENIPITQDKEVDESIEGNETLNTLTGIHKLALSDVFKTGDDVVKMATSHL